MTPEPKAETPTVVDDASVEEGVDELEGSEDYSGDRDDSVEPEPTARKAKRARSSAAKPKAPRKKYVRGKQGGLQGIMKMPLEIFTEIAYHITPGDLIVLVRCNKFFRNMLLRRSAMVIWQHAAQNVPGLPPCPTGMCEPQYAALMFSKSCTLCGATATAKPDPFLQVRLCSACRDTKLESRGASDYMYSGLISRSHVIKGKVGGRHGVQYYCLSAELEDVRKKSQELLRSEDRGAYGRWSEEKCQDVILRFKDASVLQEYIVSANKSHGNELANMKKERRDMVCERLKALGWTEADQQFSPSYAKAWNSLVDIAKPLTDRTWSNLLPKLTPLLEENRVRRLKYERMDRRTQRRRRLHELLSDIKDTEHPFGAAIEVLAPEQESTVVPVPDLLSTFPVQRRRPLVKNPFPPTATVLQWECVRDLGETEIELEKVEELFKERREQFDQCLADWRAGLEERLVGIIEAGVETIVPGIAVGPVKGEESQADPIVKVKGSTDTTEHLCRNVRLLLRADTIFKDKRSEFSRYHDPLYYGEHVKPASPLCYYPDIIAPYDSFFEVSGLLSSPSPDINVEQYLRYTEAENLVKKMLMDMQMPDVARMELDVMKARFACGRCNERSAMTWDQMVHHYMNRQRQWEKESTQKGKHSTIHPVLFRNVHDPEWTSNPKPLVRVLTAEEATTMNSFSHVTPDRVRCMLCLSTGRRYTGPLEDAKVHLQDVHDVAEPTEGLYYRSERNRYHTLVTELMSDEWHKEWDEFHDALAISASVSAMDR